MIDKKVLLLIGALVVVAIIVLAVGLLAPSLNKPSGSSFSALFDKMVKKSNNSNDLVLSPSSYASGDKIIITDKIIAIKLLPGYQTTTLYFLYQGTEWINKSTGTSFDVLTDLYPISVEGSSFSINIGSDLSVAYNVGSYITLQGTVFAANGHLVLGHNLALAVA